MSFLPVGKLRAEALQAVFDRHPLKDPRVVVGPRIGEDAAVLDVGDRYLVATTDPITFATADLAWYVVHVNANDVAVRGARPRWLLTTVLLPDGGATEEGAAALIEEIAHVCAEIDVSVVGGHTEVTHGLDHAVVVGTMLGEVAKDRLVTTAGAQVGDVVIMTKGIPLEGAAIIAREKETELLARGIAPAVVRKAKALLRAPGISVLPEAEIACEVGAVHAMHDATEGGIATALREIAEAAGVGLRIDRERIMTISEGARLCAAFGLDPLGTIASGCLLVTLAPADAGLVLHALAREGIDCHFIGKVVPREDGVVLVEGNVPRPMPTFARDEIVKIFGGG
ncbi:MAG TPA: AIR synthase family protein [Methylomirabilota bacterium]|jgi:hydrogenase maturation factor